MDRPSGRARDAMRAVTLETDVSKYAEGSCLVKFGDTHVLCAASIDERMPPFLRNSGRGRVPAEYGLLPPPTPPRVARRPAADSARTERTTVMLHRDDAGTTALVVVHDGEDTTGGTIGLTITDHHGIRLDAWDGEVTDAKFRIQGGAETGIIFIIEVKVCIVNCHQRQLIIYFTFNLGTF